MVKIEPTLPSLHRSVQPDYSNKGHDLEEHDAKKAVTIVTPEYLNSSIASMKAPPPITKHDRIDTIEQRPERVSKKAGIFQNFVNWLDSLFGNDKDEEGKEPVQEKRGAPVESIRPRLESPGTELQQLQDDMDLLTPRIKAMKDEVEEMIEDENDAAALRLIIESIKDQRITMEEISEITKDVITKLMDENRKLQKEYVEGKLSVDSQQRTNKVLGWVNAALNVVLLGASVVGWGIATAATGGAAAIPVGFMVAEALAGVTSGALTISQGAVKYDSSKKQAELLSMRETREMNNDDLKKLVGELQRAFDQIEGLWSSQKDLIRSTHEAARMV